MALVEIAVDDQQLLPLDVWLVLVKARAGFQCERCESTNRLAGHHKDEDKNNNRLSNGEALCGSCHSIHHRETNIKKRMASTTPEERSANVRRGHETYLRRKKREPIKELV